MRRSNLILTALASALLLTACGGAETTTSSSSSDSVAAPQATNSVDDVAAQLKAAAKAGDCSSFIKLYTEPGVLDCNQKRLETTLATTKISGQAQYGTGGVIDVTDALLDGPGTYVLAIDASGRFVIEQGPFELGSGSSVGSQADQTKFDTAANNVVDALRQKDCDLFFANALTGGPKEATCEAAFSNQNPTIALLSADESAEPEYLGGNDTVAFYSLSFNGKDYLTMPVVRLSLNRTTPDGEDSKYLGLVPVAGT